MNQRWIRVVLALIFGTIGTTIIEYHYYRLDFDEGIILILLIGFGF